MSGTAGITALVVFVVWFLGFQGVRITAEGGAAIAGVITATFLVINDRGIAGIFKWIWRGNKKN